MANKPKDPNQPTPTSRERLTRRSFLGQLGAASVAAASVPVSVTAQLPSTATPGGVPVVPGTESHLALKLRINGVTHAVRVDSRTTLLDCLRETVHLTGTKKGCDHGQCGACTVHVNDRRVNSCLSFAAMHQDDEITTIEGIGAPDSPHPMQAAFVEHDGYQCGYCTAGQIMSAVAMLREPCGASDGEVKQSLSGNICRCGAYPNIVAAVQAVRGQSQA